MNPHSVTVTPSESGVPEVRFVCTAGQDAPCRNYPDKEWRGEDDPDSVPQDECRAVPWFAADIWEYEGEDRVDYWTPNVARSGPVAIAFDTDHLVWEWEGES